MKTILLVILLTITSGCTTLNRPSPETSAIADIATTAVALSKGYTELNPLGFAGSTLFKGVYLYKRDSLSPEERATTDRIASSLWLGAAVNNLAVLAGVVMPFNLFIGSIVALSVYNP